MQSTNALRLAQARIGAVHLGIAADSVVQAIPAPDSLALLPLRGQALRGVIEHGGALVPVVDLARWVEVGQAAPAPGESARILVLREGARSIGLLVDALGGLVDVDAAEVRRLHHGDDPDDVFHSAVRAPDGAILSLLEVARLADLALAWSAALPAPAAPARSDAGPDADAGPVRSLYALLDTGRGLLGVAPADLAEVLPMPALERLGGGAGGAYCGWRGRHLAVLPCAAVMEAEEGAADGAAPLLAVLVHAGLALGLPVRGVRQLRSLPPGLALADGVTASVFDEDGGEVRLLDSARLFARFPEAALSRQETPASAGSAQPDAGNDCAYIVFEADGLQAVPIGAVERIVPLVPPLAATMAWEGRAIPLADRRAASSAQADGPGHVLVAAGPRGPVGHVVARVHSLIPARTGRLYRMGVGAGRRVEFITAGDGDAQASYRIVELAAGA